MSKNTKMERKLTKYVLLYTYYQKLLQQKNYKLNTTIMYTKMTNNNDIKQFLKWFDGDGTKAKIP